MGEVYRARDTRLDRVVAIKTLPSHLCNNPDSQQRFAREARTISSLNHPHICVLHDLGKQDGTSYLVMEYIEGESLEVRLQKGPLPLKQVLAYGEQICDALEKAHRAGIVHRDLKPGNIMLTSSGAKLLDFGLAKPVAPLLGSQAISKGHLTPSTPTVNLSMLSATPAGLTQQGTVVGTFQYMAPEVLQGRDAGERRDIFSLGCVLYEMVTGRRTFSGKSQISVLTAILEKDPEPINTPESNIPTALEHLIFACLTKDPSERLQAAHDVKLQLGWVTSAKHDVRIQEKRGVREKLLMVLTALFAAATIAATVAWFQMQGQRAVTRVNVLPAEGTHLASLYRNGAPALSPHGTRLIFVASREGTTVLWLRNFNQLDPKEIPETTGAYFPFWSPDGKSIGFFANGKLWRMDPAGGSPAAICDAPEARGGTWTKDNLILFAPIGVGGVMRVTAQGGVPARITPTDANLLQVSDRWPFALPDGKHFVYLYSPLGSEDEHNEVHFASIDGKENKILLRGSYTTPEFASGWLLAGLHGALVGQRFDPTTGTLSGDPLQVAGQLQTDSVVGASVFSLSQNGVMAYVRSPDHGGENHILVDSKGKQLRQLSETSIYGATRLSPDDTRFASEVTANAGVFIAIWDLARGTRTQISERGVNASAPVWSADGRTIFYGYAPDRGRMQVYKRRIDGSGPQELVLATAADAVPVDVSADNRMLLYEEGGAWRALSATLKALPLSSGSKPFVVLDVVDSSNAVLKPLGNDWIAYQSSESGRPEIYVTRFPSPGAKYQVSFLGGTQPVWSRDGKRLYYLDAAQKMTAVDLLAQKESISIGKPTPLFQTAIRTSVLTAGYDVTRDGRFLQLNSIMETSAPVTVVMNWDAELKK